MSRPFSKQSHSGAKSAVSGESHSAKGHSAIGLAVDASNLDSANDTLEIRLEVEVGGSWLPIYDEDGNTVAQLTAADLGDDGNGLLYVSNVPTPKVRANITLFSDAAGSDLQVDTYVLGTNNAGTGSQYLTGSV